VAEGTQSVKEGTVVDAQPYKTEEAAKGAARTTRE
jgi:hypothetical protein